MGETPLLNGLTPPRSRWSKDSRAVEEGVDEAPGGDRVTPGVLGQAFSFDGASYVEAPTIGLPTGNEDRTIDLWFKIDSYSDTVEEAFLAGYGAFGSFDQAYAILVSHFNIFGPAGDRVVFSQWGSGVIGGPAIATDTWHNLGVTNAGDFVTLYLDGTVVATGTLSIDTPAGPLS